MSTILNISKRIHINNDIKLRIDVDRIKANGCIERIIDDMPAHSLVANFARLMMAMMSNIDIPEGLYFSSSDTTQGTAMLSDSGESFGVISSVAVGNPTRITLTSSATDLDNSGNEGIQIMGVGGVTPDINGFYPSSDITHVSNTQIDIDVDTTGSPAFSDEGARVRVFRNVSSPDTMDTDSTTFGAFRIAVGRSVNNNVVDQQSLVNEFDQAESATSIESYELVYTDTVVSAPSFDFANDIGELFFSGIITNNSGASQTLNELGLYAAAHRDANDNRYALIARDLIAPNVTLAQGESAAVTYRLQTTVGVNGGILEQFLRALYRQFAPSAGNTTLVDINSFDHSGDEDTGMLLAMGVSGSGTANGFDLGFGGDSLGIQVGTDNTAVIIEDRALGSRIDHGEGSGEFIHYGQFIDNFEISSNVAQFKIVKYFENVSGSSIDVDEIGLYVATEQTEGQLYGVACIYREILSSTQTVDNGEILKVELCFQVTVDTGILLVNLDDGGGPFNISAGDYINFVIDEMADGFSVVYNNQFDIAYAPAVTNPENGYLLQLCFPDVDTYQIKATTTEIATSSVSSTSLVTVNVT